jgi:2-oxoacid dehydrogenases acyltransferase (catalytic domain)
MFGVAQFDAILPPGTGSILAIAASTPKVVQLKTGHFGVQKSMTVTITCDHRHIYGADAAEFLKDLAGDVTQDTSAQCSAVTLPPVIVVDEGFLSGQVSESYHHRPSLNLLYPFHSSLSLQIFSRTTPTVSRWGRRRIGGLVPGPPSPLLLRVNNLQ